MYQSVSVATLTFFTQNYVHQTYVADEDAHRAVADPVRRQVVRCDYCQSCPLTVVGLFCRLPAYLHACLQKSNFEVLQGFDDEELVRMTTVSTPLAAWNPR